MGSLVAALGSWLRAREQGGLWLLRMEDLDPPREVPGAADRILRTLEVHGLKWDGAVVYQSSRLDAYQQALEHLIAADWAYPCYCSRKQVAEKGKRGRFGMVYPGSCRNGTKHRDDRLPAWRVRTHDRPIDFSDLRYGHQTQRLETELGDFVIKRADGFFAYQLAVVVDDAYQAVTEVVRGADLLDNTPRQIHLQQLLGHPTPDYLHLPLVTNDKGQKLSKQTFAKALLPAQASANLLSALRHLGISLPAEWGRAQPDDILQAALAHTRSNDWNWHTLQTPQHRD